jgi:hypothetical protein
VISITNSSGDTVERIALNHFRGTMESTARWLRADHGTSIIAESRVLGRISNILSQAGISHFIDPKIKRFGSNRPYLGIYKTTRRLLFTHYYEHSYIQAIIQRITSPDDIRNVFGIEGEDNWGSNYKSKTHYVFDIPLMNEKLNGKWTVKEKADFFVHIAQGR